MAAQLADAFGVVVHDDTLIPELLRRIRLMGCIEQITSMRSFDIPIPQFRDRKDEVEEKFVKTARRQLEEESAQLIVEGCMGIFSNLGPGARERIEKTLGVPVLEPGAVAVKTAEMLISLNITHSKKTYPSPPEK
jgi:allantoin racemase